MSNESRIPKWSIHLHINGDEILTIEPGCICGENLTDFPEDIRLAVIDGCAALWSFLTPAEETSFD